MPPTLWLSLSISNSSLSSTSSLSPRVPRSQTDSSLTYIVLISLMNSVMCSSKNKEVKVLWKEHWEAVFNSQALWLWLWLWWWWFIFMCEIFLHLAHNFPQHPMRPAPWMSLQETFYLGMTVIFLWNKVKGLEYLGSSCQIGRSPLPIHIKLDDRIVFTSCTTSYPLSALLHPNTIVIAAIFPPNSI